MPLFTIIAGPNGSGKSTLSKWNRESLQGAPVLDPDAMARSLQAESGADNASAINAGRAVLQAAAELLAKEARLRAIETTLSGNTYFRMMKEAQAAGYETLLLFVGPESIDINLSRVHVRVMKGGHNVPEEDQRRRYPRSMCNMQAAFQLANAAVLYDNSSQAGFLKVAVKGEGRIELHEPLPQWAEFLRTPSRAPL